jgi:hypothetical protein
MDKNMDNKAFQEGQQGSGSAENTGRDRQEQQNDMTNVPREKREDIVEEAGLKQEDLTDISELGQQSGRDDYAGSPGDDMSGQSTGQRTDR